MNDMYYDDCFNGYSYDRYQSKDYRNDYSLMPVNNERMDTFFNPTEGFSKGNMQANIYKPYKLTNPQNPQTYNERQKLLLEAQKYGFAMWDLNLYLNTHPTDRNVLFQQGIRKGTYLHRYYGLCIRLSWPCLLCHIVQMAVEMAFDNIRVYIPASLCLRLRQSVPNLSSGL